jgi:hypothetical protein
MKKLTIFTLLLTVITSFAIHSCSQTSSNTPGESVKTLFDYVKAKDFEKTISLYVTKEGNKLSDEEEEKIEAMISWAASEYDKKDGIDKVTIDTEEISEDGNSAEVTYTLYFNNGETSDDKVNLIKVNEDWVFQLTNK